MSKRTVELELATPGLDAQGRAVRLPLAAGGGEGEPVEAAAEPDLAGEHIDRKSVV